MTTTTARCAGTCGGPVRPEDADDPDLLHSRDRQPRAGDIHR